MTPARRRSAQTCVLKLTARVCIAGLVMLGMGLSAAAKEPSAQLKALQSESTEQYRDGHQADALATAERALTLAVRELGADDEQVYVFAQSAGFMAEAVGDLARAERYGSQAVRIGEKLYGVNSVPVSLVLERLAAVVLKAGRPAEAQSLLERSIKIREAALPNHAFNASGYGGLADVKRTQGDLAGALAQYRKAITLLKSGNSDWTVVKSLYESELKRHRDIFVGLSRTALASRGAPGADPAALIEESYVAGQEAWTTAAASALAKMTVRLKASDTDLGRAVRQVQELSDRIIALHESDMQAIQAWSEVQRADPDYSELMSQFRAAGLEQNKVNAPLQKRQTVLITRMQAEMARCQTGEEKPGCDASRREIEAITKEVQQLSAEIAKSSEKLMAIYGPMVAAEKRLPGYADFTSSRAAVLDELQSLEMQVRVKRAEVVAAFPQYLALSEPAPVSIAETQSMLRPDEALVSILVGSEKTIVWAVSRDGAEAVEVSVGEKVLAEHVALLRQGLDPLAPGVSDSVATMAGGSFDLLRAHVVYRLLLEPVKALLAGKQHVLLVPTGALTSLPFQVLLTEPPRAGSTPAEAFRDAAWLIRRHALSVLPSVESLRSLRQFAADGKAVKPFLGLGDPVFGGSSGEQRKRGAAPEVSRFYRNGTPDLAALQTLTPLPETAQELQSIAQILGASADSLNLRQAATETRLKSLPLRDYRILHFATHGLVAGDLSGLMEPALVLTPPQVPTEQDDGLLTASEIAALSLDADWVVLSACNTASGDRIGAEALSGLARAFFFAGARALLVSHWSVYSQAAVELTTRTFANLKKAPQTGRAEAFREGMLSLVAEGRPPSYWAPFVIVGEGGPARLSR